jgi:hypothetical protein
MKPVAPSITSSHLAHLSQLDHLRPPTGWKTDCAVLSTYSAHTSVLAAVLLALSGQEDEIGSGSKVAFARALTELRGKVHFVLQSGRLVMPKSPPSVVALLDRFLLQVPWDEGAKEAYKGQSWHAKFALVRHVPAMDGLQGERWVFMLGSRNLTLDMSWDMGLVLKTVDDVSRGQKTSPQSIEGIQKLADSLIGLFPKELKPWALHAKSLANAKWQVPSGVSVDGIHLELPGMPGRRFPQPPSNMQRVLAVAPFLDGGTVATVAAWGGDGVLRQLVSTRMALDAVAVQTQSHLAKFDTLLALSAPDHEVILGHESTSEEEQVAADQMGLHAKLLFAEHATGCTLWMGSPNLTSRAWSRNAECYVHISIPKPIRDSGKELLDGLNAFVDLAKPVALEDFEGVVAEVSNEMRLSEARIQVAARMAQAVQCVGKNHVLLIQCAGLPHPDDSDIKLFCGPLTGQPVPWPVGLSQLEIAGAARSASASNFMRVLLQLEDIQTEWLQVVPWNPALTEERDTAVLSDYLGPRQMLSWIHEVLNGYSDGDEGGAWDAHQSRAKNTPRGKANVLGLPSIDQALRMWLKDKTQLNEVDRILKICDQRRKANPNSSSLDEKLIEVHLQKFSRSWLTLRKGLKGDRP